MLKVFLLPDSFKGSLTSSQVSDAIRKGIKSVITDVEIISYVIADGGEGTVDAFVSAVNGSKSKYDTVDAYLKPIKVEVGILDQSTVVIEVASVVGLNMYDITKRNVLKATSYGVGVLLSKLKDEGYRNIIIGLGGSCTNDGGMGLLQALNWRFFDDNDELLPPQALSLAKIKRIDNTGVIDMSGINLIVASDVDNPLLGSNGATMIYGPQKGANKQVLEQLEYGMRNYVEVMKELGLMIDRAKGAGAAGGLGAALIGVLKADKHLGIDLLLQYIQLESKLDNNCVVISGEGKTDSQSLMGKVVSGIANITKKRNVPFYLISGCVDLDDLSLNKLEVKKAYAIRDIAINDQDSFINAYELIINVAKTLASTYLI